MGYSPITLFFSNLKDSLPSISTRGWSEVKIVELTKKHDLAREDLSQMNMALDSKQQELELVSFNTFN